MLKIINFIKDKKMFFYGLIIAFIVILLDQLTKHMALNAIEDIILKTDGVHTHIKKTFFLNLVLVWNNGISFGLFNYGGLISILLLIVILFITMYIVYNLWNSKNTLDTLCFSLMFGGAVGNIIDRIIYGAVIDFIDIHIGNLHWPAFNIADSCICVGIMLYLLIDFVLKKKIN